MADPFAWTPADGDTVHFRSIAARGLKTGRYRLEREAGAWFALIGLNVIGQGSMEAGELQALERTGLVTPISPAELERERQAVQLRCAAPLRGPRHRPLIAQDDASGLALFRHACEPSLF